MPNHVQTIRRHHPTNPHDLDGRRGLDRHSRVQLDDGHPGLALRFPHVRHWSGEREDRSRWGVLQVGRFDLGDWRWDGVVGNVLYLVHPMSHGFRVLVMMFSVYCAFFFFWL